MREAEFLHYCPGNSLWHRHDPRLKLLELIFWTVSALAGSPLTLGVIGFQLIILHGVSGTRLRRLGKPLFFWLMMAIALVIAGGLSRPQPPLTILSWITPFGTPGLLDGGLRSVRLLVILMAGQLMASTTDPAELADAVRQITFFLPKNWSGILAAALSLTIAFIPRLLDEAATVSDAAFSRGLGERRSIFRRALALGLPLAEGAFRRADMVAEALLSRCFSPDPTPPHLRLTAMDLLLTGGCLLLPGVSLILN